MKRSIEQTPSSNVFERLKFLLMGKPNEQTQVPTEISEETDGVKFTKINIKSLNKIRRKEAWWLTQREKVGLNEADGYVTWGACIGLIFVGAFVVTNKFPAEPTPSTPEINFPAEVQPSIAKVDKTQATETVKQILDNPSAKNPHNFISSLIHKVRVLEEIGELENIKTSYSAEQPNQPNLGSKNTISLDSRLWKLAQKPNSANISQYLSRVSQSKILSAPIIPAQKSSQTLVEAQKSWNLF